MIPRRRLTLLLAPLAVLGGCSSPRAAAPAGERGPIRVDAVGLVLGGAREDGTSPQELVEKVDELLRAGRRRSAEELVHRFPDAALVALLDAGAATRPVVHWIARVHEARCGGGNGAGSGGFAAVLRDWSEHLETYDGYARSRTAIQQLLRDGRLDDAAGEGVPRVPQGTGAEVLRIEAERLHGNALLLADRPVEAARVFERAAAIARLTRPYEHANLLLLLAEAFERSDRAAPAADAWRQAVARALPADGGAPAVFDPGFWVRAASLRGNATWPEAVAEGLVRLADRRLPDHRQQGPYATASAEASLWLLVGLARLERHELRAALVAFGHAEAHTRDERVKDQARLYQARVFLRLGESTPALTLLSSLAGRKDDAVARPALGLLGALELKLGRVERGVALLAKAVTEPPAPGSGEACANLGLGHLLAGRESEGLRWLRTAERLFAAEHRHDDQVQCLKNQLRHLEQAGRVAEAEATRTRLDAVERSAD